MGVPPRPRGDESPSDNDKEETAESIGDDDLSVDAVIPPAAIGRENAVDVGAGRRPAAAVDDDRGLTFEQIHRKYQTKIYNAIYRWVGDADDAEDLTLETFTNAFRHWDRFRGDSKVSTWLYQIATNCCKNRYKQRDRQREREAMSLDDAFETDAGGEISREVADWSYAPERLLLNQEMVEKVREAIDALPTEYRIVLVLSQREDMSYEEIAQVTGLTVPNVKTRLHRARNRVRQRLEPYYRNWNNKEQG